MARARGSGGGAGSTRSLGLAAMVRVLDGAQGSLDFGAGIRPWWVDTTLRLHADAPPDDSREPQNRRADMLPR
ncbi:hypothetical protein GXW74_16165 [Roseomonas eburnea]|uniref:Uncharacterized protein n=1 Tax=Neoroseomonas eburnea TaxID=1346889 RepID=A0A9X9XE95_9PROT|nr:hypothetical protein [Neoroseomonas eburnea]MBR0682031.1 hypothetical protein [Neoroseomonas eburnea]